MTARKRSRVPYVLAVAALTAALTAAVCSGGARSTRTAAKGTRPAADCAWRLSYGKREYVPPPAGSAAVRHEGVPLGQGSFPGCGDGGDGEGTGWTIAVYRIAGVDPAQAVVTVDDEVGVADPGHLPARLSALLNARG